MQREKTHAEAEYKSTHTDVRPHTHTDRQTDRGGQPDLRDKSGKTYITGYLHNRENLEKKQQKPQRANKNHQSRFFLWFVCIRMHAESGEEPKCFFFFFFMCTAFQKEREVKFSPKPFPKKFHTSMRV